MYLYNIVIVLKWIIKNINKYKKSIRVRIVIALKNEKNNHNMLNKIQKIIGGRVVIERQDKYVTWIASNKSDINKVLLILSRYPLLTIRKQCQLDFAKNSLLYKDVDNFMLNRKNMYNNMNELLKNGIEFKWSTNCDAPFKILKKKLVKAPVLSFPK